MTDETVSLSAREVSEMMGIHMNTVRAMAEDGRLKGYKTKGESGHWRFNRADVEAFLNLNKGSSINSILSEAYFMLNEIPENIKGHGSKNNIRIWENINKFFGIRSVFGSIAVHSDNESYADIVCKKGFVWIGEGSHNAMEFINNNKNGNDALSAKVIIEENIKFGFGVIKYDTVFFEQSYSLVPVIVVTDNQCKVWIVDGTMQQFYPGIDKGLVIMPLDKAKNVYINLNIYTKKEFSQLYSDPKISERMVEEAKKTETEIS